MAGQVRNDLQSGKKRDGIDIAAGNISVAEFMNHSDAITILHVVLKITLVN